MTHMIKGYRVRAHTLEEGWNLCKTMMMTGCEGVQNDSSRYNDIMLGAALRDADYCYVGICGTPKNPGCLRISSVHDKYGKRHLKEIGRCKFMELFRLEYKHYELPRSLKYLQKAKTK